MENTNKVIVITGASSGVGLATANYLFDRGYIVYGIARRPKDKVNPKFNYYEGDVCDSARMKQILDEIYAKEGKVDVLYNNAGFGMSGAVEYAPKENIQKQFDVNVVAAIDITRMCIPYLRESKGKILYTSSPAAAAAVSFQACYCATKAALEVFALALAKELKPQNIKVSCIRLGDIKTGFTDARLKNTQIGEAYGELEKKKIAKMEKYERNGIDPIVVAKYVHKMIKKKNPPLISSVCIAYKLVSWAMKVVPTRFAHYLVYKIY